MKIMPAPALVVEAPAAAVTRVCLRARYLAEARAAVAAVLELDDAGLYDVAAELHRVAGGASMT